MSILAETICWISLYVSDYDSVRNEMLEREMDKGLKDRREGITVYRDIGAYVTIRIVTHDVLLVVVPSLVTST